MLNNSYELDYYSEDDYSDDDPYANYLHSKYVQDRMIKKAAENISSFVKKPENEIKSVLNVFLPILSNKNLKE